MKKKFDLWVHSHPTLKKLIMELKIAMVIIVVSVSNVLANPAYSQEAKVSLDMKNASLEQVMDEIESQSEFYFIFNQKQIDVNRIVDIQDDNKLITDILPELFKGTNVNYAVFDRKILLTTDPIGNKLIDISSENEYQQKQISGTVTDKNGPIPGVNVVVPGTSLGAITDSDGKYRIEVSEGSKSLKFSFIGMETQEITIGSLTQIDVTMVEAGIGLEEVVVIGYGTQKKVNVIGSVTTVSNEDLNVAPVSVISNAIAGRMPGVIVQQGTGEPGNDASSILIRGKATLGDNSPLVVVDGIAGRDMNSLASTDIESITVLKDASAAIYGARAANGVILITTKRGTVGAPTFTYGFYQGRKTPTVLPELTDAATYAQMIREVQSYRGVDESNMQFSLEDIEKYKSGGYPWTHPNTDWFDETLKKYSITRNHNLSVSGGTQAVTYYGSFSSQFDDGLYKNSSTAYKRYNIKANVDAKVNKYIRFGIDVNGSQENHTSSAYTAPEIFQYARRQRPTDPAYYPNGLPGPDIEYGNNPVVMATDVTGFNDIQTYRLNTIFSATLTVPGVKGLTLSGYYAYDKYFSTRKFFQTPFTLYSLDKQAYLNAGNTGVEDGSAFISSDSQKGPVPEPQLHEYRDESYSKAINVKANYETTIGGVHNISAFISMESLDYETTGISAYRRYFLSKQLPYLFAGGTTEWSNDGTVAIDSRLNYFGRVMYNFKETYLIQFSLRRDGSLRFSEENGRWGLFPSILAGWRISNENFWKNNIKFINYLKLKASFGQMGNDQVDAFQYMTLYGFGTGAVLGSGKLYQSSLVQSNTPNPYITWEKANVYNIGFESAFLNSRLTLNADFFYQRRSDILVQRNASVPNFTGITLPDENYGIVDNKGFEIESGYADHTGDFSYSISGNIAFARNKVVEFDEPEASVPWQRLTGHPQGSMLLYKSIGIYNSQEEVNATPHVEGARAGDIIIQDTDNDKEITSNDRIIFEKNWDPEVTYGITFGLSYKNWDLKGLIQGTGQTLRTSYVGDNAEGTEGNYLQWWADDRWTVDNIDGTKPRAHEMEEEYWMESYLTDFNYQKGGYGRLKNLQLTYHIPQRFLKAALIKDFQLYFSSQNLLFIYNQNKLVDPEAGLVPVDVDGNVVGGMELYPIMKTFILGLKIAF
jgi:TonB-dependent starch-binding outer membrane protein SusC